MRIVSVVKTGGVVRAAPFLCPLPVAEPEEALDDVVATGVAGEASDGRAKDESVAGQGNETSRNGGDGSAHTAPDEVDEPAMLVRLMVLLEAHLTDAEKHHKNCGGNPTPADTKTGLDTFGQILRHKEKMDEMKAAHRERARRDAAERGGADAGEVERTAERVAARIEDLVEIRARELADGRKDETEAANGALTSDMGEAGTEP